MTHYAFDPELAAAVATLPKTDHEDVAAVRAQLDEMLKALPAPDTSGLRIENRRVPGPQGHPEIGLRIYRPERPATRATVYDIHGGGFIAGSPDLDHMVNVRLARELGAVVVSVDYRLAPETPFPGGLEDVYAGLLWTAEHADELGIDANRIAVRGASAGGGLAAALALLARDRGGPPIAFQFLSIPELDDRLDTPSMRAFTDTPMWNGPAAMRSWNAYLGPGVPGSAGVSPYAAPARATDLRGLPPAYMSVMQFDPLRDEGIAYAQALLAAGVTVELHLFPGTFHGSTLIRNAAISRREADEAIIVLRNAIGA
jgi:acetyl esterase/lipase